MNIDLPPVPEFSLMKAEAVGEELEVYLKKLTDAMEEMLKRVLRRAQSVKNSVEIESEQVQLVNDESAPGVSKYYGTDGDGVKGWFVLP